MFSKPKANRVFAPGISDTRASRRKRSRTRGKIESLEPRLFLSAAPVQHDIYAVNPDGTISIYDIDNGHQLIKTLSPITNGGDIRGVAASAVTGMIYVSYIGANGGAIYAMNLVTGTVVWNKVIQPSVDRLAISPDGKTLYSPTNEADTNASDNYINIIDASNGNIERRVTVTTQTHDTDYPLSGPVFQSSKATNGTGNYLYEIDPTTFNVTKVGPFKDFLGPYAVNGTSTYAVANVEGIWGFQVADLKTNTIVTVNLPGTPPPGGTNLLHGIAWTPDESQVWLAGGTNNPHVYIFDMTNPMAPTLIKTLTLNNAGGTHWITFSIDGAYAYVDPHKPTTDPVEVFDTKTDTIVATLGTTEEQVEVDFTNGVVTAVSDQFGIGRVTGPVTTPTVGTITDLTLVNADTGVDIEQLTTGMTLDYATLPTRHLNIRADTTGTIGSVEFSLNSTVDYQTQNSAPYALAGTTGSTYNAWTPTVGGYSITVTPFSSANLGGVSGTPITVQLTVKDSTVVTPPPPVSSITDLTLVNADTGQDIEQLTDGMTLDYATLPTRDLNVRADTSGSVGSVEFSLNGITDYHTENSAPYALAGNVGATYNAWTPAVGNLSLTATPFSSANLGGVSGAALTVQLVFKDSTTVTPPPPVSSITDLMLINADTGQDIEPLTDGMILDYATLPTRNLNIRAGTMGSVSSVEFSLNGVTDYHTENTAPYTLAGNVGATYNPWTPVVGGYSLSATPFSASNLGGVAGTPLSVQFTVTDSTPVATPAVGAITDLSLINANTGQDIDPLKNKHHKPTGNLQSPSV